jgi:nitrogenase molybdenum-cofactor synthesis protein NifE
VEFEGFDGFVNFAREVDASINSPVWKAVSQRILKPEAIKSVKSERASVKEDTEIIPGEKADISEKPCAKKHKDMDMENLVMENLVMEDVVIKPEFLHPKMDIEVESEA